MDAVVYLFLSKIVRIKIISVAHVEISLEKADMKSVDKLQNININELLIDPRFFYFLIFKR